jgi:gas vesicle protein
MEKTSRHRTVQVGIWSAIAGGALGFTLGMIFAPQRGPDTRRRLAYQLEHLAAQTEEFLRRALASGPDGDQSGDELVADAQARADHIRDDIDALLEQLREQSAAASEKADTDASP